MTEATHHGPWCDEDPAEACEACRPVGFDEVVRLVREAGFPCRVEHTGGGCATILAGEVDTSSGVFEAPVLAGPGVFTGPGWSGAVSEEPTLSVGLGDQSEADDFATAAEAAEAIVTLLRAHVGWDPTLDDSQRFTWLTLPLGEDGAATAEAFGWGIEPTVSLADLVGSLVTSAVFAQLDEPADDDASLLAALTTAESREVLAARSTLVDAQWQALAARLRTVVSDEIAAWKRDLRS